VAGDYVLQDDSKFTLPAPQDAIYQAESNPNMNLYWGELHIQTAGWVLKMPIALLKVNS